MIFVNLRDNFASLQFVVRIVKNILFSCDPYFLFRNRGDCNTELIL